MAGELPGPCTESPGSWPWPVRTPCPPPSPRKSPCSSSHHSHHRCCHRVSVVLHLPKPEKALTTHSSEDGCLALCFILINMFLNAKKRKENEHLSTPTRCWVLSATRVSLTPFCKGTCLLGPDQHRPRSPEGDRPGSALPTWGRSPVLFTQVLQF